MTTEVIAAARWPMVEVIQDLSRMASDQHLRARLAEAYTTGRKDRLEGRAFADCPYKFKEGARQWAEWRRGWNVEDIALERSDFKRVSR